MTREETVSYLKAYLDGDTNVGNVISLREVLESAIEHLEISLPSNLDEAAEEIALKVAAEKYPHGKFDGEEGDSLRAACAVGYLQAEKDTIKRACEWLFAHLDLYVNWYNEEVFKKIDRSEFIKAFRLEMEDEK